jgi:DNA primase
MDQKEKAKNVKIEKLYPESSKLIRTGNKLRGFCPFHGDKSNPNFFIYLETNTWYCFAGCGGGDSILFYMKLKDVDFKTALKKLGKIK